MAPRRASTRGGTSTPANRWGARGGIRKNTRNRQPPNRYGQLQDSASQTPGSQELSEPSPSSGEVEPSIPQYSFSPLSNAYQDPSNTAAPTHSLPSIRTPTRDSDLDPNSPPHLPPASDAPINLSMMRDLLQSHEQEIVERVVHQRGSQNPSQTIPAH